MAPQGAERRTVQDRARRTLGGPVMNAVTTSPKLHDCRDAFVSVLERLGAENPKVVAVCNDSVGSSKLGGFKSRWPER
ncbi:MAG TPA: transketolase family protein, partial [Rhizobium sp.]|nr:transketolase family protein [Rhizobium sp.]